MTASRVDGRPVMVTEPGQLRPVMHAMATEFPDIHEDVVAAMARTMRPDGVMEFTVSGLAKDAEARLTPVKNYLKVARQQQLLHMLGRRTDNGKIRYCAYQIFPKGLPLVSHTSSVPQHPLSRSHQWRPTWAQPPGETLREWMTETGTSEAGLSKLADIDAETVSAVLDGTQNITPDIALRLEQHTKIRAQLWLNLQAQYDDVMSTMPLTAYDETLDKVGRAKVLADEATKTETLQIVAALLNAITEDICACLDSDPGLTPQRIVTALRSRVAVLPGREHGSERQSGD